MRSRAPRFLLPALASLVAATLAFACGTQEVTIPQPAPPDGPAGQDGATDAIVPDASIPDAAPDVPVVCPEVLPDDATGVYVGPSGVNSVACGTRASPCKTVSLGVMHAVAASRPKVYVSRGTYVERLTLAAGIEVIGGWDVPAASTNWRRACITPQEIVILRAPAGQSMTVEARDLGGEAGLSLLRIESKLAAQVTSGESLYGVVAVGSTTTLMMTNVQIDVGAGGPGVSTAKGGNGPAAVGTCPAGTGLAGTAGAQGSGAAIGGFDISGYQPAVAASGVLGTAGANGVAGTAGTCVTCGTCGAFPTCDFIPDPGPQTCGKTGASGCGGGPGVPGAAATGGGTSIGVYAWDAAITITGGKIKSGDGGNGGNGGGGGNGGAATAGVAGAPAAPCVTACAADAAGLVCTMTKAAGLGGAAGGAGGLGGAGGTGGGGGGGSSFAIYQGSVGVVNPSGTTLVHGKAGTGGGVGAGAGAPGAAADRVP